MSCPALGALGMRRECAAARLRPPSSAASFVSCRPLAPAGLHVCAGTSARGLSGVLPFLVSEPPCLAAAVGGRIELCPLSRHCGCEAGP